MSVISEGVRPRDRRRAETVAEIKQAALEELATSGTGGLSLRAVARAIGTTVQALYHYFPSREALLTELVVDNHNDLAAAIQRAADATVGRPRLDRLLAVNGAYRQWAFDHRAAFLLLYGTPVPGFEPTPDGRTVEAAIRQAQPFSEAVFDGWTPEELAQIPVPPGTAVSTSLQLGLPPGALQFFFELRARLHGIVMLELLGHLYPFGAVGEQFLAAATHRIAVDIDDAQQAARAALVPTAAGTVGQP